VRTGLRWVAVTGVSADRPTTRSRVLAAALAVFLSRPVAAVTAQDTTAVPVGRDALIGAAFLGGALAVSPLDSRLAIELQRPASQGSAFLRNASNGFDALAVPGAFVIAAGLYAGGWLARDRPIATVGLHSGEALIASAAATEFIGAVTGRARPSISTRHSGTFVIGKGFGSDSYASLPSEHATAAFALASVVAAEVDRRWPKRAGWVKPAAYAIASLVGVARTYKNQHWLSDVVVGAGIGTTAGLLAVQYRGDQFWLPH